MEDEALSVVESLPRGSGSVDMKTILMLVTFLISLAVSYATLSARVEESNRRITAIELSYVPRTEHEIRDRNMEDRLKDLEIILRDIQSRLMNVSIQQR